MANAVSVKDYLSAYKPAYDAVKADGNRKRGEKAYENLLAVADRTDDMQEAQLIIEKEGLLLKLTTEDALDIHENTLAKLDPLDEVTGVLTKLSADMYRNAKCVEDIAYRLQFLDMETLEKTALGKRKLFISTCLAKLLIKYDKSKRLIREWIDDAHANAGVVGMVRVRAAIKMLLTRLHSECDFETEITDPENTSAEVWNRLFDEIFEDQYFMIQMLSPANTGDGLGRTKSTMHPDALLAYRAMLEEIVSDKRVPEILKEKQKHAMVYRPI